MVNNRQQLRSRLEFSSSEEWISYVEASVAVEDHSFVFESGLTALYLRFYEVRGIPVPEGIVPLIEAANSLQEPTRTTELKSLNARLFSGMTRSLAVKLPRSSGVPKGTESGIAVSVLLGQLVRENEPFALWSSYKRAERKGSRLPTWEQYIRTLMEDEEPSAVEFALSMATLGELLKQLSEQKQLVPSILANRIRALHRERKGPERELATRTVLQQLLEVITPCMSA